MNKVKSIRGMHDLTGDDYFIQNTIKNKFEKFAYNYNFKPLITPIMEFSDIFNRTLGNSSDVVMKEMYTFLDKSEESLTLRPEGTAGIARAIISNGLTQSLPLKFYYYGPMFRYERPQKGRLRQFTQIGVEMFSETSFFRDYEVIQFAYNFLKNLNISHDLVLQINNLGNYNDRTNYIEELKKYYLKFKNQLSKESIIRLEKNPLRILDSKDSFDIEINKNAPAIGNFISNSSKEYFDNLKNLLQKTNISYSENFQLVRGLDYYSNTIFEFTLKDNRKHAVLAGGSYNNLVSELGGPMITGVGWAAGVERIANLVKFTSKKIRKIIIIALDENSLPKAYSLRQICIDDNLLSEIYFSNGLKKALKYANKIKADFALIIGEQEIKRSMFILKNLVSGKQELVKEEQLKSYLNYDKKF